MQKVYIGADTTLASGYITPVLAGFISGCAVSASSYWHQRALGKEKDQNRAIKELNKKHEEFLQSLHEGILTVNKDGICIFANNTALEMFGYTPNDILGKNLFQLIDDTEQSLQRNFRTKNLFTLEDCLLSKKDGSDIVAAVKMHALQNGCVLLFNETSSHHLLQHKIDFLSSHDPLSGLLNKEAWRKRVEEAFSTKRPHVVHSALFIIDIDRFKIINDTVSYSAGDHFIKELAQYLLFRVGDSNNISRIAGDKFSYLLLEHSAEEAQSFGQQLLSELNSFETYWKDRQLKCSVSIGCCPLSSKLVSYDHALRGADAACKSAKEAGRSRMRVYDPDHADFKDLQNQMEMVELIQSALDNDLFFLRGQKIAPLSPHNPKLGMEILVSMKDKQGHVISPASFIPAAERFDLMVAIDRWVVANSLNWIEQQNNVSSGYDFVSINLSGKSFNQPDFLDFVCQQIRSHAITPNQLCFEITETAAMQSRQEALHFMQEIKTLGCRFALDDFGSGMSSFEYLRSFPVDFIKLDGSFVRNMETDALSAEIVASVQRIGETLRVKTIAEHAETEQTLRLLEQQGYDYVQGYIIDKPAALERTERIT
ncbi:MAG: EAL domain-containing protein [Desulfuromonadaceae bacterium]|nr:EAL domain-containing protein [Desulfuromonadaceae bacterium]